MVRCDQRRAPIASFADNAKIRLKSKAHSEALADGWRIVYQQDRYRVSLHWSTI